MRMDVAIVGVLLAMVGLAIFVYGMYAMKTEDFLSSTFLVVIGVFLGMAGLFVLLLQVFPSSSVFR